jgi:tryptophan 7-halogenase
MRIVIAGGGVCGWLAAFAMCRYLGRTITSVTLVDTKRHSDTCEDDSTALIALPQTLRLLEKMGVSEADLLANAGASFHLGQAFSGWLGDDTTHFLPTGLVKAPIGPVSFHHLALRLIASGMPIRLSDYSLEAMCAQTERFAAASLDQRSVLSTLVHGLHIESNGLIAWLRQSALARGCQEIVGDIASIARAENGEIEQIICSHLPPIQGDLFLDCSGRDRVLSKQDFVVFSNDAAKIRFDWTSRPRTGSSLPLFAHSQASNGGWTHSFCTQSGEHRIRASVATMTGTDIGRLNALWDGNCVALGSAGAIVPPTSGLVLHNCVAGVDSLMSLLPSTDSLDAEAAEYNRIMTADVDQAQTWAALPFALNQRIGQPLWDAFRTGTQTRNIANLLETWTKLGRLNAGDEGNWFDDQDWISMLWTCGVLPRRYDQVANGINIDAIKSHFDKVRSIMLAAIGTLPRHGDYLRTIVTR